ncbi:MAG TPA: hypothetical protein ENK32_02025 [Anaerolineae bacterium]|nr:hypothetical protein [Anaerolineae bacterium]
MIVIDGIIAAVITFILARMLGKVARGDPARWEKTVRKLERRARQRPPPPEPVIFIGSSSIRFWKSLAEDFAPLPVLNHGFGGAQIHQATFYADRLIFPFQPQAVVFYAGDNDIGGIWFAKKKTPEEVASAFQQFCHKVYSRYPEIPIYVLSIKPSKRRRKHWPQMQAANALLEEFARSDERIRFVDVASPLLAGNGQPRSDVFRWDGVHLNAKGYAAWTAVLRPVLLRDLLEGTSPRNNLSVETLPDKAVTAQQLPERN